jgi:hypothetical protein
MAADRLVYVTLPASAVWSAVCPAALEARDGADVLTVTGMAIGGPIAEVRVAILAESDGIPNSPRAVRDTVEAKITQLGPDLYFWECAAADGEDRRVQVKDVKVDDRLVVWGRYKDADKWLLATTTNQVGYGDLRSFTPGHSIIYPTTNPIKWSSLPGGKLNIVDQTNSIGVSFSFVRIKILTSAAAAPNWNPGDAQAAGGGRYSTTRMVSVGDYFVHCQAQLNGGTTWVPASNSPLPITILDSRLKVR